MSGQPSRRSVLRTGLAVATCSLAGCQFDETDVAGGHLFVENTSSQELVARLAVAPGTDLSGDRIVDAWYRVPQGYALQFEEVLEAGQTHTVGMTLTDEQADTVVVTVRPCEGDDVRRDISVRLRPDGSGVIPWGCVEEYERGELEYVNPEEYILEGAPQTETPTE